MDNNNHKKSLIAPDEECVILETRWAPFDYHIMKMNKKKTVYCDLSEEGDAPRKCLKCKFTLGNIPCYTTTEICDPGEVCATIVGHAAGHQVLTKKKCLEAAQCGITETTAYLGVNYTSTFTCCDGDFCNSGSTGLARPSLLVALVASMVLLAQLL
ncbi:sperm acrosome membrane-associated protein 4-like isoform X2 [Ambystoma mexicanum]|uniref:sperm acrosome membrane-associated protein 4-like isoform X2 n=1 Tax=Ambystoma mexicanum TaxID=8296 RepID=UPI0037E8EBD0